MAEKGNLRDRVAQAIYETQVKRAREDIDKVGFDALELPTIFSRLKAE